jgi:hypothetical protein
VITLDAIKVMRNGIPASSGQNADLSHRTAETGSEHACFL